MLICKDLTNCFDHASVNSVTIILVDGVCVHTTGEEACGGWSVRVHQWRVVYER